LTANRVIYTADLTRLFKQASESEAADLPGARDRTARDITWAGVGLYNVNTWAAGGRSPLTTCYGGCVVFAENMSTRSGHVDVNERRLRPIYGQDTDVVVRETCSLRN